MNYKFIILIILFIILNSKSVEKFNNDKYFNLKKRIEPLNNNSLHRSKLFDQREFIKPNKNILWNSYFGSVSNSRVKEYDRLFFKN